MQNMNYYYDFSGQKFGYPLSLSINGFQRHVFSRQSSLELSYVLKGSYEAIAEQFTYTVKEHELIIIAPNDIHMLQSNLDEENVILTIHIDFDRFAQPMVNDISKSFTSMLCTREQNFKLLGKLKQKIGNLVQILLEGSNHLLRLNVIMMELIYIASNRQQYPIESLPLQSDYRKNYMKAILYIDQHYKEDLHLDDLADTLSFSVSYTSRLFKKYSGIPFVKYLANVRIRASIESLLEGILSIESIAAEYGMTNSKAYTAAFKEMYGIVPSEYRKQFSHNMKFNEEHGVQQMELDDKARSLLQHFVDEVEEVLYENDTIKISNQNDHIICHVQNVQNTKSTIIHTDEGTIIDICKTNTL